MLNTITKAAKDLDVTIGEFIAMALEEIVKENKPILTDSWYRSLTILTLPDILESQTMGLYT